MSTENDLSDEAMNERLPLPNRARDNYHFRRGWLECRDRAEAQIETLQKQIGVLLGTIHEMDQRIETEKRETWNAAWEAVSTYAGDPGWHDPLVDPDMARDEAYRAYTEAAKEEK